MSCLCNYLLTILFVYGTIFQSVQLVSSSCTSGGNTKDERNIQVTEDAFGSVDGQEIRRFTITNSNNVSVQVISYGAITTSIRVPGKNGIEDLVLGYDNMDGYINNDQHFGGTIGRVANRIANGQFVLNGVTYNVSKNVNNKDHLHGGFKGFDKVVWDATANEENVTFKYVSADGEEGYPGELTVTVTYSLTADNALIIEITGVTTKATPINICNHSYFNLGGHSSGSEAIFQHLVTIFASQYTPTDSDSIPTGEIVSVEGTPFDLRSETVLGPAISSASNYDTKQGFDHNFCIDNWNVDTETHIAHVQYPESGRTLDVYCNQPGVQFYTANWLPTSENQLVGKNGTSYMKYGALCLETQKYPDSVNHDNFPSEILNPGEVYRHVVRYQFSFEE